MIWNYQKIVKDNILFQPILTTRVDLLSITRRQKLEWPNKQLLCITLLRERKPPFVSLIQAKAMASGFPIILVELVIYKPTFILVLDFEFIYLPPCCDDNLKHA